MPLDVVVLVIRGAAVDAGETVVVEVGAAVVEAVISDVVVAAIAGMSASIVAVWEVKLDRRVLGRKFTLIGGGLHDLWEDESEVNVSTILMRHALYFHLKVRKPFTLLSRQFHGSVSSDPFHVIAMIAVPYTIDNRLFAVWYSPPIGWPTLA